jgi:hypothetical protein
LNAIEFAEREIDSAARIVTPPPPVMWVNPICREREMCSSVKKAQLDGSLHTFFQDAELSAFVIANVVEEAVPRRGEENIFP